MLLKSKDWSHFIEVVPYAVFLIAPVLQSGSPLPDNLRYYFYSQFQTCHTAFGLGKVKGRTNWVGFLCARSSKVEDKLQSESCSKGG